jgi:protein-S-isoprenylcysteine O-methyltransferase Ste14
MESWMQNPGRSLRQTVLIKKAGMTVGAVPEPRYTEIRKQKFGKDRLNTGLLYNSARGRAMHTAMVKRFIPISINLLIMAACLFGLAGRLYWWNGWVLLALSFIGSVAATTVLWRDPSLAALRRNMKAGKTWDKAIVLIVVLLGPATSWITAGLDTRFHGSRAIPLAASAVAAAVALLGTAVIVWAMGSNKFFSAIVRIQKDRAHTVVTGGPYRFIRHPAYAGMSAFMLATPLILNSRWAIAPAAVTAAVIVLRTALEDRALQKDLDGYDDYARRVRYKLLPAL